MSVCHFHLTASKKSPTKRTRVKKTKQKTESKALSATAQHASPQVVGYNGTVRVLAVVEGGVGFIIASVCAPSRPACISASAYVED